MKALLIIDMQKVSFTPATPRYKSEKVIKTINILSDSFRKSGDAVIIIQHDGSKENYCKPGTEEWEILDEITRHENDTVISKTANDSFYKSALDETLKKIGCNEIIITGCATDYCVDSTVKSALTKDYLITVISDGHTAADRPYITAENVIKHHNWLWADMIPTLSKIEVISCSEYLKLHNN